MSRSLARKLWLPAALLLITWPGLGAVMAPPCKICAVSISVQQSQVGCLRDRVTRLLATKSDPLILNLRCDRTRPLDPERQIEDPVLINPSSAEQSRAAGDQVVVLQRRDVICLSRLLRGTQPPLKIDFRHDCEAS